MGARHGDLPSPRPSPWKGEGVSSVPSPLWGEGQGEGYLLPSPLWGEGQGEGYLLPSPLWGEGQGEGYLLPSPLRREGQGEGYHSYRIRGSRKPYRISTATLIITMSEATKSTTPCTTGRSRALMAPSARRPRPGR